ncbi:MAG: MFS transporter [Methanomassiliicoccaceae archaeon]|jgi:EmrB/QacA subfamily drug resistance transporter|nr:MFS transporter [Methanomassiliicoccaceae archaeon]
MSKECEVFSMRDKRIVLIACCIAGFISPLLTSMINLAVPSIALEFGISAHDRGWLVMTFFLSSVAFLVPVSRIADLYGKKKLFIIGIIIVLISSLMSPFSSSFSILLIWRIVAGIGTACISSTSISMIAQVYPRAQRGLPLALNTMCIYIGASMGPGLGGILTETFGWQSIFFSLVPFSVAAFVAIMFFKTDFKTSEGEPFDMKGTMLYGLGVMTLMYGILTLPDRLSPAFIAAGAVLLVMFYNFETKEKYPVLNVGLFKGKVFRRSNIAAFLNYGSSYAIIFTLSQYLQDVGGMSPGTAGLIILLQPAVQAIITPFAGRMSDRMDPRILTTAGMIMMCVGTGMMITLSVNVDAEMTKVYAILLFTGLGYALFSSPNTNLIMGNVSAKNYSEASGLISVMRQVGMMSSVAVVVCMISVMMGTTTVIEPGTFDQFMTAVRYSFVICFLLSAAGALMTWYSRDAAPPPAPCP